MNTPESSMPFDENHWTRNQLSTVLDEHYSKLERFRYAALGVAIMAAVVAWSCVPKARHRNGDGRCFPTRSAFWADHVRSLDQEAADDYSCIICRGVCEAPVRIEICGHVTCRSCLRDWLAPSRENTRCPQCQTTILTPGIMPSELLLTTAFCAAVFNLFLMLFAIPGDRFALVPAVGLLWIIIEFVKTMWSTGADWWRYMANGFYADVFQTAMMMGLACFQLGRFMRIGLVYRVDLEILVVGVWIKEGWVWVWRGGLGWFGEKVADVLEIAFTRPCVVWTKQIPALTFALKPHARPILRSPLPTSQQQTTAMETPSVLLPTLLTVAAGCVAWCYIPTTKQPANSTPKLPTRKKFFRHHLHLYLGKVKDVCIICREDCKKPLRISHCGHFLCEECAVLWFEPARDNRRCSQCQQVIMRNPEKDKSGTILDGVFAVMVMSLVLALQNAFTRSYLYFIVVLVHCFLVSGVSGGMLADGEDWWREVTQGPKFDFFAGTLVLVAPWCAVGILFFPSWLLSWIAWGEILVASGWGLA